MLCTGGLCVLIVVAILLHAFSIKHTETAKIIKVKSSTVISNASSKINLESSSNISSNTSSMTNSNSSSKTNSVSSKVVISSSIPSRTVQSSSKQSSCIISSSTPSSATTSSELITDPYKRLAAQNSLRALTLASQYNNDFYNTKVNLLWLENPNSNRIATAWEYGAFMSMQSKLAVIDKNQIPLLNDVISGMDYYGYLKDGNLWGYVVNRGWTPLGATNEGLAYDDNIWIAINFIQAYEVTGNKAYLDKAKYLADFLIREAWFEPLGGFFWDTRHEARHSCSNNPAIKLFVDISKYTDTNTKTYYLDWAKKIYDFSYNKLKNTDLNIYRDLIGAKKDANGNWVEGTPDNAYYAYNTGAMISGASALYGATGDKKYLNEALSSAKGAFDYFGNKSIIPGYVDFAPKQLLWFNCILLRGYIDLYPYAKTQTLPYIDAFQKSIDYGYDNYFDSGYMPTDWITGDQKNILYSLDESSNIEMYAMLSQFQNNR